MEHLLDRDPAIVFLTETWLKSDKNNVTALVKTYGYTLVHNRRKNRQKEIGGGVGLLIKIGLQYKRIDQKSFSSFEHMVLKLSTENGSSLIRFQYIEYFLFVTVFLDEIIELFEFVSTLTENIVLAGDINIHMDEDELYSNRVKDIINTFNLTQHVNFPTHKLGHIICRHNFW